MASIELRAPSLGCAVLLLLCGGCASSFHEHHYFKSLDAQGMPQNYFRIKVDGFTLLSSSRYISGYFDEKAVNTYFDEYVQPDNAHFDGTSTPSSPSSPPTTQSAGSAAVASANNPPANSNNPASSNQIVPLAGQPSNAKLVLLLSTNSDQIAQGISSLATSSDVTQSLTNLVSRDRVNNAQSSVATKNADVAEGTALNTLGAKVGGTIPPPSTVDVATADAQLLAYANSLANFLEPGTNFGSLTESQAWITKNSARLRRANP